MESDCSENELEADSPRLFSTKPIWATCLLGRFTAGFAADGVPACGPVE